MSFWLPREFTVGIDFQYPVEFVRRAIAKANSEGADAIVLTGHMGLKPRTGGDDFANTVMALTSEFPDVAVFIAGHTHQAIPGRLTNGAFSRRRTISEFTWAASICCLIELEKIATS